MYSLFVFIFIYFQEIHYSDRFLFDQIAAGSVGDPVRMFVAAVHKFLYQFINHFRVTLCQIAQVVSNRCTRIGSAFPEYIICPDEGKED
jgi:hypothetical protein